MEMGADDHDLLLYFDGRWLRKGADLLVLPLREAFFFCTKCQAGLTDACTHLNESMQDSGTSIPMNRDPFTALTGTRGLFSCSDLVKYERCRVYYAAKDNCQNHFKRWFEIVFWPTIPPHRFIDGVHIFTYFTICNWVSLNTACSKASLYPTLTSCSRNTRLKARTAGSTAVRNPTYSPTQDML